jgi:hypothetical protein
MPKLKIITGVDPDGTKKGEISKFPVYHIAEQHPYHVEGTLFGCLSAKLYQKLDQTQINIFERQLENRQVNMYGTPIKIMSKYDDRPYTETILYNSETNQLLAVFDDIGSHKELSCIGESVVREYNHFEVIE